MMRHFTTSAVVFDAQSRVLLVHHTKSRLWLYPGGHLTQTGGPHGQVEEPSQAAAREVREETGIIIDLITDRPFTHLAVAVHPAPLIVLEATARDPQAGDHRHIDFLYVGRPAGGLLNPQLDEVGEVRWVPLHEVAALPVPVELPELLQHAAAWADRVATADHARGKGWRGAAAIGGSAMTGSGAPPITGSPTAQEDQ
jgi:8-oxo-dGTP diphosphatase